MYVGVCWSCFGLNGSALNLHTARFGNFSVISYTEIQVHHVCQRDNGLIYNKYMNKLLPRTRGNTGYSAIIPQNFAPTDVRDATLALAD